MIYSSRSHPAEGWRLLTFAVRRRECRLAKAAGDQVVGQAEHRVRTAINVLHKHVNVTVVPGLRKVQQLVKTLRFSIRCHGGAYVVTRDHTVSRGSIYCHEGAYTVTREHILS